MTYHCCIYLSCPPVGKMLSTSILYTTFMSHHFYLCYHTICISMRDYLLYTQILWMCSTFTGTFRRPVVPLSCPFHMIEYTYNCRPMGLPSRLCVVRVRANACCYSWPLVHSLRQCSYYCRAWAHPMDRVQYICNTACTIMWHSGDGLRAIAELLDYEALSGHLTQHVLVTKGRSIFRTLSTETFGVQVLQLHSSYRRSLPTFLQTNSSAWSICLRET